MSDNPERDQNQSQNGNDEVPESKGDARESEPVVKDNETISIRVVSNDSAEVTFKIKRTTGLKKLMDAYCARQGKSVGAVRFLYDGTRIAPTSTPAELEMEDGDAIDVMIEQIGGSSL